MVVGEDDLAAVRESAVKLLGQGRSEATRDLLDKIGAFDRALWAEIAQLGWLGIGLAEESGGFGLDLAARCVLAEELGRALASVPYSVSSVAIGALARESGSSDLVADGVAGELLFGIAPPRPKVTASFADGRLSGAAATVVAGAFADHVLVALADDRVVLVAVDQAEVERRPIDSLDNSRGYADLRFDAAPAQLLAATSWPTLRDELALLTAFEQVGGAQATLELTRDYALERRAFGQQIGAFQGVKHVLADFYVAAQLARGGALAALQAPAAGFGFTVAAARLLATEAYEFSAQESIQLHGGIGGTWEATPQLHYRRARCLALELGAPRWWRDHLLALAPAGSSALQGAAEDAPGEGDLGRYRARARAFLAEHAPRFSGDARKGLSLEDDLALGRAWQAFKADHGYAAIHIDAVHGGGGGTAIEKVVFSQEEQRYDLPTGYFAISQGMPVPMLAAFGTEEQQQAFLRPAIRGETIWCQLFSEPAAGSDLAALRMTARREGDRWILNGQKLWTSWAHISDYGIIVARHDPELPKHKGLTYFLVDMRSPGVTIRPVRMLGPSHVNEVFFDEVEVPDGNRVGAVGEGFPLAVKTLMIERYQVTDLRGYGPDPIQMLREADGSDQDPRLVDADLRIALAEAICGQVALAEIHRRAFSAMAAGKEPGPEGSITKLVVMAARQKLSRAAMDAEGAPALARRPHLTTREDFTESWLLVPLSRIAGGTDQILRNTIAERILGLPQDHRPDKGVVFRDIPR